MSVQQNMSGLITRQLSCIFQLCLYPKANVYTAMSTLVTKFYRFPEHSPVISND